MAKAAPPSLDNPALARTLHRRVANEMGRRILRGDLLPGDAYPGEGELGAEFGVSRTVLREASRILTEKGLISAKPKVGTVVRPRKDWNLLDPDLLEWAYQAGPSEHFVRNLTEVRLILEPAAAELAAVRARDDEVAELAGLLDRMDAAKDDPAAYAAADLRFHAGILVASHNELLEQLAKAIGTALRISRSITVHIPGSSQAFMPAHRKVYTAVARRDPSGARAAMTRLIEDTGQTILDVLRERGGGDGEAAR